jgi:hypothetical protein
MTDINGSPAVLWVSNTAADLFGRSGENNIMMTVLGDGGQNTEILAAGVNSVLALNVGKLGGFDAVAIITCDNNDPLSEGSKTLRVIDTVTGGDIMVMSGELENAVFYGNELYIYGADGLTKTDGETQSRVYGHIADIVYDFIVFPDGRTALVFKAQAESGTDLYAVIMDGDITEPVLLTRTDSFIDNYALKVIDGRLMVAYIETVTTFTDDDFNTCSNFNFMEIDLFPELVLENVQIDTSDIFIRRQIEVEFELMNRGLYDVREFDAEIIGSGGRAIASRLYNDEVVSGGRGVFVLEYNAADAVAGEAYTLVITYNGISITQEIDLSAGDLAVETMSSIIGGRNIISFSVINKGNVSGGGTLYGYNGIDGEEVIFREVPRLNAGEYINYTFDASELAAEFIMFVLVSDIEEINTVNNRETADVRGARAVSLGAVPADAAPTMAQDTDDSPRNATRTIVIIAGAGFLVIAAGVTVLMLVMRAKKRKKKI